MTKILLACTFVSHKQVSLHLLHKFMVLKARYRRKFVKITSPEALWTNRPPLLHTRRVALLTLTLTLLVKVMLKMYTLSSFNIIFQLSWILQMDVNSIVGADTILIRHIRVPSGLKVQNIKITSSWCWIKKTKRVKIYRVMW